VFGELVNQTMGAQETELPGDEGATPTALWLVARRRREYLGLNLAVGESRQEVFAGQ
jgi:hypothetical protein